MVPQKYFSFKLSDITRGKRNKIRKRHCRMHVHFDW